MLAPRKAYANALKSPARFIRFLLSKSSPSVMLHSTTIGRSRFPNLSMQYSCNACPMKEQSFKGLCQTADKLSIVKMITIVSPSMPGMHMSARPKLLSRISLTEIHYQSYLEEES